MSRDLERKARKARAARIAKGLTQKALADRMGVSQPYISLMESAVANPRPIIEYFKVG